MFTGKKTGFAPHIGDYCVVLAGDTFYPAVIGDAGPTTKIGEASLKLCKQINGKANGEFRPVSDLRATYLIFPNSADEQRGPPDLRAWQAKCEVLLKELDDYTGTVFAWEPPLPPEPPAVATGTAGVPATGTAAVPATGTTAPAKPAANGSKPTAPIGSNL
jgi:hypothetical protein